jgi:hypothetical protein
MRQWGNGAIVAFACCCTLAGAQETIAPLASVCVSATAAGTPARGLAPADFLLLEDGEATGNLMPYALVEQRAIAASVEVSFLMPPPAFDMRGGGVGNPLLPVATERPRQMAAATGGLLRRDAPLDPAWSMQADLRLLLNGLKGEYCLGFRASALDGKTHTLRVTSRRPGIVVRGPRAFVARR